MTGKGGISHCQPLPGGSLHKYTNGVVWAIRLAVCAAETHHVVYFVTVVGRRFLLNGSLIE
jgi:hypothetical protein